MVRQVRLRPDASASARMLRRDESASAGRLPPALKLRRTARRDKSARQVGATSRRDKSARQVGATSRRDKSARQVGATSPPSPQGRTGVRPLGGGDMLVSRDAFRSAGVNWGATFFKVVGIFGVNSLGSAPHPSATQGWRTQCRWHWGTGGESAFAWMLWGTSPPPLGCFRLRWDASASAGMLRRDEPARRVRLRSDASASAGMLRRDEPARRVRLRPDAKARQVGRRSEAVADRRG